MTRPTKQVYHLPRGGGKNAKEWRKFIAEARALGWTWERRTSGNHFRLKRGDRTLALSMNAGDARAIRNMRARLAREERRNGHPSS
jgi:hypothetical protein